MDNDRLTLQELFLKGEERLQIRESEEKLEKAAKEAHESSLNRIYWEAILSFLRSNIPPCLLPYMRIGSYTEAVIQKKYPPRLPGSSYFQVSFDIPKLKVWISVNILVKNEPGYQLEIKFNPLVDGKWVVETYTYHKTVIALCYESDVEIALALAKRYDKQLRDKSKPKESEEKDSGSGSEITSLQDN